MNRIQRINTFIRDYEEKTPYLQDLCEPFLEHYKRKLIKEYINRHRAVVAKEDWAKIEKDGLNKVQFSWAGETIQFKPHYYRIQGPSFLLEYANTQNGANHIHATWRDFSGDFGRDVLRDHIRKNH